MELRHLRYFVMVAEEANITRASARLGVSQPAVSRQIRDLEKELGVSLFERRNTGLDLTEPGRTALVHAQEMLRQADGLSEAMLGFQKHGRRLTLRIGFIPTALPGFLAQGMRTFHRNQRSVCVEIYEMTPQQQEEALAREEIDVALLGHASPTVRRRFQVESIRKVPMAIALPDDHPLAPRKSVDIAELEGETFLSLHEKHFPGRPELMRDVFERGGIAAPVALLADSLNAVLGHVGGGRGVALLPADAETLPHPGVVFVKLKRPRVTLVSSAAWSKDRESSALLSFVKTLKSDADPT